MTIRVLLADDQALIRTGFRMVLDSQADMNVVGEAADGREAVALTAAAKPDVVLMDVRMPDVDGIEATKQIVLNHPDSRVLILTTFDLDEYAFTALRAGASGFLLKDVVPEELLRSIRAVASGDAVVAPSVTRRLLDKFVQHLPDGVEAAGSPDVLGELTDREREVLVEVANGYSNAEIAEHLYLSDGTVKTHVGHILSKLNLRDRVQVVVFAHQNSIV